MELSEGLHLCLKPKDMEKFNNFFLVPVLAGCVMSLIMTSNSMQKDIEELQKEVACQSDSIKQLREDVNNFY